LLIATLRRHQRVRTTTTSRTPWKWWRSVVAPTDAL